MCNQNRCEDSLKFDVDGDGDVHENGQRFELDARTSAHIYVHALFCSQPGPDESELKLEIENRQRSEFRRLQGTNALTKPVSSGV